MTPLVSTIITGIITLIVGGFTLLGVIYQSNKSFDKQQANAEADRKVLEQKFDDYKEFLHQINKGIKDDICTLSKRVDEHNNYGIKIPLLENRLENVERRLAEMDDK